jgi:hypothetical protein
VELFILSRNSLLADCGRGSRLTDTGESAPTQINVVLNWFEELKRRVPTGKNP